MTTSRIAPAPKASRMGPRALLVSHLAAVTALGLLASGCASTTLKSSCLPGNTGEWSVAKKPVRFDMPVPAHDPKREVLFRYLGNGGVYFEWMGTGVLIDPQFTVYDPTKVRFGAKVTPDAAAIERGLQGIDRSRIQALLVGSSGFERLSDIVAIGRLLPNADIYVNETGKNLMAPYLDELNKPKNSGDKRRKVRAIDGKDTPKLDRQWTWLKDKDSNLLPVRIRAMALPTRSESIDEPLESPWEDVKLTDFVDGAPFAFFVEFFKADQSELVFRALVVEDGAFAARQDHPGPANLVVLGMKSHTITTNARATAQLATPEHAIITDALFIADKGGKKLAVSRNIDSEHSEKMVCSVAKGVEVTNSELPPPTRTGLLGVWSKNWTMPLPGEWLVLPTKLPAEPPPPNPEEEAAAAAEQAKLAKGGKGKKGKAAATKAEPAKAEPAKAEPAKAKAKTAKNP